NNNNANFQQYYQPNQNGGYPPNNNNNSGPLWLKIFIPSLASVAIVLVILFATGVIKPNNTLQSTPVPVSEVTQETTSATTAAPQVCCNYINSNGSC
ncbi:MAG: hypothetical protein KBT46_09710, partial [Ruminococcus sp.]|nr:hypothetical protein [Candidatus Copronaster equi]